MRRISYSELTTALTNACVQRGDIVHVQSDLRRMGPVETAPQREAMLEFYLAALRDVVGPEGTITAFTATYSLGHTGQPFVRERTPSELGAFSEYIRTRPGAVRSIHPLASVAGIGQKAHELCGGSHRDGFGYDSPWGQLHRANAIIISIGVGLNQPGGTSIVHYVERIYGVPYRYTKVLSIPVFSGDREVPGPFTFPARYLHLNAENWTAPFKQRLVQRGAAKWTSCGGAGIFAVRACDFVAECIAELNADPWCLLKAPPQFTPGVPPFDGLISQAAGRSEIANEKG